MTTKMKSVHTAQVITWMDGSGNSINICRHCQERMESQGVWPKSGVGVEYCQVSRGLHRGQCEIEVS